MKTPTGKKLVLLIVVQLVIIGWFFMSYILSYQMARDTSRVGYRCYPPFTICLREVKHEYEPNAHYKTETFYHAKLNKWEQKKWKNYVEKFPEDKFSHRKLLNHLYDTEDPSQYKKYVDFSDDILESIDNNDMKTEKDNITFDRYI